ncbi:MAG TPA: hypothetical protein DD727_09885 [Clostridiales bacterium]|nr:hypothetical protein [Clostridiales bacterium]
MIQREAAFVCEVLGSCSLFSAGKGIVENDPGQPQIHFLRCWQMDPDIPQGRSEPDLSPATQASCKIDIPTVCFQKASAGE